MTKCVLNGNPEQKGEKRRKKRTSGEREGRRNKTRALVSANGNGQTWFAGRDQGSRVVAGGNGGTWMTAPVHVGILCVILAFFSKFKTILSLQFVN